MDAEGIGQFLTVTFSAVVIAMLIWAGTRRRPSLDTMSDERVGTPYRIYTRQFDLDIVARDVPAILRANPLLRSRGWVLAHPEIWKRKVEAARRVVVDADGGLAVRLQRAFATIRAVDWAICFLVDQSGSMKDDPIRETAAALRWCSSELAKSGTKVAILGYSTVGWLGGEAGTKWVAAGRPKRPGRLAALLHIRYQMFDEQLDDEDWSVMLHPDILRENIDGEALAWAGSLLDARPEPHRLLIVLSDGAPVDDATLMHNGPSYLWRHLEQTIAAREAISGARLAAVGLNHLVDELYTLSRSAIDPADLAGVLIDLLTDIATSSTA